MMHESDSTDLAMEFEEIRGWLRAFTKPVEIASAVAQVRDAMLLLRNWRSFISVASPTLRSSHRALVLELRNGVKFEIPPLTGRRLLDSTVILALREVWLERVYYPPGFGAPASGTTVDLGANVGFFTVLASRESPHGRVVSVEPVKSLAELLRRNVEGNCGGNVELCNKGVLDQACSRPIWIHPSNIGGHSIFEQQVPRDAEREMTTFITLADLFSEYTIDHVDLLKLDVEGAEFPIVLGSTKEQFDRVDNVSMEYHLSPERKLQDLVTSLHKKGFQCTLRGYDATRGMLWASRAKPVEA